MNGNIKPHNYFGRAYLGSHRRGMFGLRHSLGSLPLKRECRAEKNVSEVFLSKKCKVAKFYYWKNLRSA